MKTHILCLGDSNTHGYCADPNDCADHGIRFNEDERWTCLLQKALGEEYLVLEEGLSGRTTVFSDPLHECMSGLDVIYSTLMSHEPVDLLIIMLGTNDLLQGRSPEQAVERLIRHAVESVMDAFGVRRVYGFFGNSIDPIRGKPTNAEMIGMLAQYMRVTPED